MHTQINSDAIVTKYHGPTNTKPSRISVFMLDGTKKYFSYDHELTIMENHKAAAKIAIESDTHPDFHSTIKGCAVWNKDNSMSHIFFQE